MIRVLLFSIVLCLALSCRENKETKTQKNKTEIVEIYETYYDGEGYRKGSMKYYESKNYRDGKHIETYFYQPNGEVKGYEIIKHENVKEGNSIYYDQNDQALSYYQHTYDKKGRKKTTNSYDASNDELLRIENYHYKDGNLVKKEIKNAQDILQRSFYFVYDKYGNETEMYVIEAATNDTIATQKYEITEYNPDNSWKEKWGFQGEKPTTYQIKK